MTNSGICYHSYDLLRKIRHGIGFSLLARDMPLFPSMNERLPSSILAAGKIESEQFEVILNKKKITLLIHKQHLVQLNATSVWNL